MPHRFDITEERIEMAKLFFRGMKQSEIAKKFGVHPVTVSQITSDPKFRRIVRERYNISTN